MGDQKSLPKNTQRWSSKKIKVEFDLMVDSNGRPIATHVVTKLPPDARDWVGLRVRGYIKNYNAEEG
jgi:hypothetical protein